jgi:PA14 domain
VRGYITAPATGSYRFWIASDNASELWLSTSSNPANKARIARVINWTNSRQWTKESNQRSAAISLVQDQRYYVEALQKEGTGGDNLAVGWAKPGQSTSAPSEIIPGAVLTPFP